ncbi:type II secretion system F family protein [Parablautia muri]|uniref:Type II secretion system protein GspF domain-containing protein n=1 Tax=Parablautia muri TaxID=2320879 RepID=A0A9X5GSL3_9FIRM|nr:hypothetical protein [Parablautia muri]NBJ94193.1 hypothetical protein [Parablautia muri]
MWTNLKGQDSSHYELLPVTVREKRWLIMKSFFIVLFLDYFFYQSIWAIIPLSGVGYWYYQLEKRILFQKKKEQAREQFKELMLLAATGQKAGYSAENAFLSSYQDMRALFGRDSTVCRIINLLKSGRENNIAFSKLWQKIGSELQITEIIEFAQVYEISQKSSGNLASVMEKTADIIIHKIETEKEIAVLLSARRLEQKIMNVMPFLILLYISITSPGYFRGMYHSLSGILVMSVCLSVYLGAYALSVHMISVEI